MDAGCGWDEGGRLGASRVGYICLDLDTEEACAYHSLNNNKMKSSFMGVALYLVAETKS